MNEEQKKALSDLSLFGMKLRAVSGSLDSLESFPNEIRGNVLTGLACIVDDLANEADKTFDVLEK